MASTPAAPALPACARPRDACWRPLLIWREGDDLLLMLPRDILPAILKKLSMYVLRSKVKLSDATPGSVLIGYSRRSPAPSATLVNLPRRLRRCSRRATGDVAGDPAR